ncbi:TetR/AcrR family transcriptional regulator C-terminal domain-containing protein [Spongiactinospora sp. TRM90649]|uniref:TetR/AcrR family transcriptional regulator C-terminal domain-containing protein n=1 Tax=Spongiactinospora sp. TRM90649 TaxID=3031114 RepID=UPI0023F8129C|nr:TetR/AcrR family transcriptional regulator C-terminal domain-containing protein [Spongiactinospora sp. TRM90649]MDF5756888.1 TetR/AcrR family transcriptional regulator C-terminal domain-containing protein [Spongiactinospora sp. TRM90649]
MRWDGLRSQGHGLDRSACRDGGAGVPGDLAVLSAQGRAGQRRRFEDDRAGERGRRRGQRLQRHDRSPALYWHIRTKQELLDEMADAIIQAAGMGPPREGESWQDWLCRRANAYRAALLAHRDGARIVATARRLSPEAVKSFEAELAVMTAHGFTPALALHTITTVTYYVNGFVLQEQSQPDALSSPAVSSPDLPDPATMPTLLAAVHGGGALLGDQAFACGLRTLIRGTDFSMEAGAQ